MKTNRAHRRSDGSFEPDYQGVIETEDGASILWRLTGYGWPDEGRVVATIKHLCDDERYRWLNNVVCLCTGEVRLRPDESGADLVLDVAELLLVQGAEALLV